MTDLDNAVKKQEEAIIKVRKQLELMQKKLDELEKKIEYNTTHLQSMRRKD